jgi:hypothetical protein
MAMPDMFSSMAMGFPGSPAQKRGQAIIMEPRAPTYSNDIEAANWLKEVNMTMYVDVFEKNFGLNETKFMNRKRLKEVRLCDFPKMGICNYMHQKVLLEHIKLTLQYEFENPKRKVEGLEKMRLLFPDHNFASDSQQSSTSAPRGINIHNLKVEELKIPLFKGWTSLEKLPGGGRAHVDRTRRKSFDKNAFDAVGHFHVNHNAGADALREGDFKHVQDIIKAKDHKARRRRASLDPERRPRTPPPVYQQPTWHDYTLPTNASEAQRVSVYQHAPEGKSFVHGMDELLSLHKGDIH